MTESKFLAFKLHTKCDECASPVPLNGAWLSATCEDCDADKSVPESLFADVVQQALDEWARGNVRLVR